MTLERCLLRPDGTSLACRISLAVIPGAGPSDRRLLVQVADVSDQLAGEPEQRAVQAWLEEALGASERRFTTLFESAPIGMALSTLEGTLIAANPALAALSGYTVEELVGGAAPALSHPADAGHEANLRRELACGASGTNVFERRLVRRGGDIIPVEINAALIRGEAGTPLYVLEQITDLGVSRRLERRLQHASKLEASVRLAEGVAHDFNNMLLVVRGYAHLLLQRLAEGDPARADAVEIDLAAERAARLVGQLLALDHRQVPQLRVADRDEGVRPTESLPHHPVGDAVAVEVASAEPAREQLQAGGGGARRDSEILVVEDDHESRLLLTRVLGAAGFRVTAFGVPTQALEWLAAEERPVSLLISDIVLPAMRGPELAREVMARRAGIGVLLISGYADDAIADDLTGNGIHFLAKPFAPSELLAAVDNARPRLQVAR